MGVGGGPRGRLAAAGCSSISTTDPVIEGVASDDIERGYELNCEKLSSQKGGLVERLVTFPETSHTGNSYSASIMPCPTGQVAELLAEGESVTVNAEDAADELAAEEAAEEVAAQEAEEVDLWWQHEEQRVGPRWPVALIDDCEDFMRGRASHFGFFTIDQWQHTVYIDFTAEDVVIDLLLSQVDGSRLWSEPIIQVVMGQVTVTYPSPLPSGLFHMEVSVGGYHLITYDGVVLNHQAMDALNNDYITWLGMNMRFSTNRSLRSLTGE